MNTPTTLHKPPARRRARRAACVMRAVGLVIVAGLVATGRPAWAWPAVVVLFLIWLTNYGKRWLLNRSLRETPRLSADENGRYTRDRWPKVTLISPARNEEDGIEAAARSLARVDYPDIEIFVVDDHSTDATGVILDRLAEEYPSLRVIHDPPLQPGWLGKANAVWQTVTQADPEATWLLLTDADVVFAPEVVRAAVALAEDRGLDFLTCIPRLENGSLAEELVLTLQWQGLLAGARRSPRAEKRLLPVGVGAFILVKREAYLGSGGHSAFYAYQPEDALLALAVREWGGKLGVAWTPDLLRVRLYRGLRQLVSFAARKNRVTGDDQPAYFLASMLFWLMTLVLPLPIAAAAVAHQVGANDFRVSVTVCGLLAAASYVEAARAFEATRAVSRIRRGLGWFHPVAGLVRMWIDCLSLAGALAKRRMDWRGRAFENLRAREGTNEP